MRRHGGNSGGRHGFPAGRLLGIVAPGLPTLTVAGRGFPVDQASLLSTV